MPVREHQGRHYSIVAGYLVNEDAWMLELSEAKPAPASWAEQPGAVGHLPGEAILMALVPDEDPDRQPTVHFYGPGELVVPYEIMRWFMDTVAEEVDRCRIELKRARSSDDRRD